MQTALKSEFVSIEDYLAGEEASETRHEYVNGTVYAMAGASREHNEIIGNLSIK
jgi:Uma2 family endonuclease